MLVRGTSLHPIVPLLLAALLAAPLTGQVDSFGPAEGTIDTVVTINGSGFGTAKPKVFLTQDGVKKKRKLKVESFSDTSITARVRKALAGDYMLNVQPKGKGQPIYTPKGLFTVRLPEVQTISPDMGGPGDEITMTGRFFGAKKGKVKVGGKRCKVLEWLQELIPVEGVATDTMTVRLPKKLPSGTEPFEIKTRVGTTTTADTITLMGNTASGSAGQYTAKINGQDFKSIKKFGFPGYFVDSVGLLGTELFGIQGKPNKPSAKTLTVILPLFHPADFLAEGPTPSLPVTYTGDDAFFSYSEGIGKGANFWISSFPDLEGPPLEPDTSITITSVAADGTIKGFGEARNLFSFFSPGETKDVTNFQFNIGELPQAP